MKKLTKKTEAMLALWKSPGASVTRFMLWQFSYSYGGVLASLLRRGLVEPGVFNDDFRLTAEGKKELERVKGKTP